MDIYFLYILYFVRSEEAIVFFFTFLECLLAIEIYYALSKKKLSF